MKKILCMGLAFAMMMLCMPNARAVETLQINETWVSTDYESLIGYSGLNFYTEVDYEHEDPQYHIIHLYLRQHRTIV